MEKMSLTLDDLEVQSFATGRADGAQRGTVRGHDYPTDAVECPTSWDATCANTCADTCQCEGNTGDCTVICYTDGDCTTRGSWYYTLC